MCSVPSVPVSSFSSDQIRAQLGGVLPHTPLVPLKQISDITCHVSDMYFDFPRGQRC